MIIFSNKKTCAFTLAEILITLGIIGVVAALTIPVLMQNIQDRQFKEAAKAAYSKASQAVQLMKNDNGGNLSYYYGNANKFKPDFIQYFKIAQDCPDGDGCVTNFSSGHSGYYSLSGGDAPTWIMGQGQFITTDGIFWGISNDGAGKIFIVVDVNGYTKGPNISGRDLFLFELLSDNLLPMGTKGTSYDNGLNYYDNYYCNKSTSNVRQGWGCMDLVMRGVDY